MKDICEIYILKELPTLTITHHFIHEDSVDAKVYGLALVLGSFASVVFFSTIPFLSSFPSTSPIQLVAG